MLGGGGFGVRCHATGRVGWHNAFAPLDGRLLHLYRSMRTVEFEVEAAGVADWVAIVVTAPERGYCCAAILAGDEH